MKIQLANTNKLEKKIQAISDAFKTDDLAKSIARSIEAMVRLNFKSSKDPYGIPWTPIKYRNGKPLRDTGRLLGSIGSEVNNGSITIGTNVCYAIVHQFGAVIEANENGTGTGLCGQSRKGSKTLAFSTPGGWIHAKRVEVPARPFLPDSRGLPFSWRQAIISQIDKKIAKL